ncbi:mitochondrial import inner membrane translocase subunit Tim10 B isoform X2 [Heterodontus francisci]|uniref:mitochondrial import inner membrane translocase subunit Tim10 B isoform X2 n=1 Tax=Heterodontus francisci TaxID=7792 RepID=UPI00355B0A5D
MAAATEPGQIRNLRDFLLVYNKMTESCFNKCVTNLNYRTVTLAEKTSSLKTVCDCGPYKPIDCDSQRPGEESQLQFCIQKNPEQSRPTTKCTLTSEDFKNTASAKDYHIIHFTDCVFKFHLLWTLIHLPNLFFPL